MRVTFGEWLPDAPELANPGVTVARGVVPISVGYAPMNAWADGGHSAIDARARGSIAMVDDAGNPVNVVGNATKLYKLDGTGLTDVSIAGGYHVTDEARWEFVRWRNNIIAVNPNDDSQYFDLQTSTAFAVLATDVPRARHAGVVRNFVVLGNVYTVTDGLLTDTVAWCANNNPFSWPIPGSDLAISVLSGQQALAGGGGWVQSVVNDGAEVGGIFQEHSIWRMDFEGGDTVWRFTRVEPAKGLLIPGLAIPRGRQVLYCDEDGFYLWDYTASKPVGEERINRTFLADLDSAYLDRVSWAQDPDSPNAFILYPGSGNTGGTPNKALVYNWVLNRFSELEFTAGLELMTRYVAPGVHLDTTPDDDVDGAGFASFDQRQSAYGAATLAAWDGSEKLGTFSGSGVAATLETGDVQLDPQRRARVSHVRPLVKGAEATVQIAALSKSTSTVNYSAVSRQNPDGKCPVRSDGRYHRIRVNIPSGGFTDATGVDLQATLTGTR